MTWSLVAYANTRELAAAVWALVLVVAVFLMPVSRPSVIAAAKSLANWKIIASLGSYAVFLFGIVGCAWQLGLWTPKMLGATLAWFVVSGLVLYINALTRASKTTGFFAGHLRDTVRLAVVFEFILNVHTLDLWAEIILFPALVVLVLLQAVAESKEDTRVVGHIVTCLLALIALALFLATTVNFATKPETFVLADVLREFALPIWLALATVPFAYVAAVLAGYETLMLRLGFFSNRTEIPVRVRLGIISGLRTNLRAIDRFAGKRGREVVDAGTFRGARSEVMVFHSDSAVEDARRAAARQRLKDFAGVTGYDSDGRRLDRREFQATKDALEWLAVCHAGHYRNKNKFPRDLLTVIGSFARQGLGDPHGIVMKVKGDGKAWFAYRRTSSGYHFGMGAVGDPNSLWCYDGERPSTDYPSGKGGWTKHVDETRTEWLRETPI
ncbi:hypothetical protein [Arthrobacter sp. H14]|uniref:hypothetical protein n=1 Tax=Arthrobacter sp. H14 TaxID=1312959 RepID=UPI00047CDDFE|nr:hypothetical protein [Arthrobacter sp. H14]